MKGLLVRMETEQANVPNQHLGKEVDKRAADLLSKFIVSGESNRSVALCFLRTEGCKQLLPQKDVSSVT